VDIQALQGLLGSGVSAITIHSPQQDQQSVIEFFGQEVLPYLW
jgi:hypothetical protein